MKRRILSLIFTFLVLPFSLMFSACGKNPSDDGDNGGGGTTPGQSEVLPEVDEVKDLLVLSGERFDFSGSGNDVPGGVSFYLPDGKHAFIPFVYEYSGLGTEGLNRTYEHDMYEYVGYYGKDSSTFDTGQTCDYLIIPSSDEKICSSMGGEIASGVEDAFYYKDNQFCIGTNYWVKEKVYIPNATYTNEILQDQTFDLSILDDGILTGTSGAVVDSLSMIKTLYGIKMAGLDYERMTNSTVISNKFKCKGKVYEYKLKFDIPGLLESGEFTTDRHLMPFISYECGETKSLVYAPLCEEAIYYYDKHYGATKKYDYVHVVYCGFNGENNFEYAFKIRNFYINVSKYTADPEREVKGEIHTKFMLNSTMATLEVYGDYPDILLVEVLGSSTNYSVGSKLFTNSATNYVANAQREFNNMAYLGFESDGTIHVGIISDFFGGYRD